MPDPVGSMPGYRRPVLIIQADSFNQSSIQTILVAVFTSNLRLTDAPGNVFVSQSATGLDKDSVVNVSQLVAIDRSLLIENIGELTWKKMSQVENGLRMVLSL